MTEHEKQWLLDQQHALRLCAEQLYDEYRKVQRSQDAIKARVAASEIGAATAPAPLLEACDTFIKIHSKANPVCLYCGCGRYDPHKLGCAWLTFCKAKAVEDARKATKPPAVCPIHDILPSLSAELSCTCPEPATTTPERIE